MTLRYNETTSFLFIIQRTIFEIRIPTQGRVGVELRYLPPANEVCKGYVFTGVYLSTGGGCLPLIRGVSATHPPEQTHPWADTSRQTNTPPGHTSPCPVLAGIQIPLAPCMLGYTLPPSPPHPMQILRDTVNKQAVRIPLECILVLDKNQTNTTIIVMKFSLFLFTFLSYQS